MLNIEDFEQPNKKQNELENIREVIKKEYENILKEKEQDIYKKGYEKGYKQAQEDLKNQFFEEKNRVIQKIEEEKKALIKEKEISIQKEIEKISSKVKEDLEKFKENLLNILLDSIGEILEILFISPENKEFLKKVITDIIEEFEEEKVIKIIVNKELIESFKDFNYKIEEGNIDKGIFVIKFDNFYIESKLKEKVETIKNEIKREIKSST